MPQRDADSTGTATLTSYGGTEHLDVTAGLPDLTDTNEVYEMWLFNDAANTYYIGVLDPNPDGNGWTGSGELPPEWEYFDHIDVSVENAEQDDEQHSGRSVLRGDLAPLTEPE
jgi:hypothetical protein